MSAGPVVIDLGVRTNEPPAEPAPSRPALARHLRTAVTALVVALVLAVGGSAPQPGPALVEVAAPPTSIWQQELLVGDRLYVVHPPTDRSFRRTVTAYDLTRGADLWTTPIGVETRALGPEGEASLSIAGERLLVHTEDRTFVLDTASGRLRASVPHHVTGGDAGNVGLVREPIWSFVSDDPAVNATVRVVAGASGEVVHVTAVEPGEAPRVSVQVDGVSVRAFDLDTGAELWATGSVTAGELLPGEPPSVAVLTRDGVLEVRDARTGAVRHSRARAVDGSMGWLGVVGDLVLVQTGLSEATAYAAGTLETVWRAALPRHGAAYDCGAVLCVAMAGRSLLIDAGNGRPLGEVVANGHLDSRGGHLLRLGPREGELDHTVDPYSGRPLVDLSDWPDPVTGAEGSPLVLTRPDQLPDRAWFAVLEPGATRIQVLGPVPHRVSQCQSSDTHLACRTGNGLRVWTYR
ncbi:PQQ-binding-like beta-propeller repeat protein [Polymorphospora sp. NPDC050346]|uniref:outer membrane protein assembly factor BamB family protein n=1 Tax=Polymorphospora sp. NPDC050346 TaxID=3155780 RepID=UPI0033E20C3F